MNDTDDLTDEQVEAKIRWHKRELFFHSARLQAYLRIQAERMNIPTKQQIEQRVQ